LTGCARHRNAAGVAFFDTSRPIVPGNPGVFQTNIISAVARRRGEFIASDRSAKSCKGKLPSDPLPGCRNCRGRQVDGSRAAALGAGNAVGVAFFDTSQPLVLGNPDVFQMNIISAIARRNDNRPDNIAAVQWRVNYAKSKTRFRGNL
jgi:hypothetical protein